jgi:hypothetical protein
VGCPGFACETDPTSPQLGSCLCAQPTTGGSGTTTGSTGTQGSTGTSSTTGASGTYTNLLFTEYVKGSSNNKALEIFNGTASAIDLGQYQVWTNINGGTSTKKLALSGSLPSGGLHVICHTSFDAGAGLPDPCNERNGNVNTFNGDDGITLTMSDGGTQVDRIGDNTDPGTSWSANGVSTVTTIRRKCTVFSGDTDFTAPFDPSVEWIATSVDDFSGLGNYPCPGSP